jgi:hypothetical protein
VPGLPHPLPKNHSSSRHHQAVGQESQQQRGSHNSSSCSSSSHCQRVIAKHQQYGFDGGGADHGVFGSFQGETSYHGRMRTQQVRIKKTETHAAAVAEDVCC